MYRYLFPLLAIALLFCLAISSSEEGEGLSSKGEHSLRRRRYIAMPIMPENQQQSGRTQQQQQQNGGGGNMMDRKRLQMAREEEEEEEGESHVGEVPNDVEVRTSCDNSVLN